MLIKIIHILLISFGGIILLSTDRGQCAVAGGVRGPSQVSFTDDNGTTITLDFSDIEFFPANDLDPFYSTGNFHDLSNDSVLPPVNLREQSIVLHLIDVLKLDSVDEESPRIVTSAKFVVPLRERYPTTELSRYYITFNGVRTARDRKFNNYQFEKGHGIPRERKVLANVNVQRHHVFGRKVIRFAFVHSYNRGFPQTIWLTDDVAWRRPPLRHIGKVHTRQGWAKMWADP